MRESSPSPETKPKIAFAGNTYDLSALGSTAIAVFTITSCCGASYCWPLVGILLGIVGLISAKDSVDPERTRLLSWLGIGGGLLFLALIALAFLAYIIFLVLIAALVPESQRAG